MAYDPARDLARSAGRFTAPFTGHTPADLTHVLRTTSGPPGLAGYRALLRQPPEPVLMEQVAAWIRDHTSS